MGNHGQSWAIMGKLGELWTTLLNRTDLGDMLVIWFSACTTLFFFMSPTESFGCAALTAQAVALFFGVAFGSATSLGFISSMW
jgi:hypothetical protein